MTICIAAKCGEGVIFGAADRMKTSGDIQFEPYTPKIFPLTTSITVMTAGDAAFQDEIIQDLRKTINSRIQEEPSKWLQVAEIAHLYAHYHNLHKLKRAENSLLIPLGLDKNSFIARQNEMLPEFITNLSTAMLTFNLPAVSVIITGIDEEGAHIYVVNGDHIQCMDTIGFASIGIGSRHAESQFMLARHSSNSPLPDTLLLTYSAKKRSEISPGVGKETDMFVIGNRLGSFTYLKSEIMEKLDNEYKKIIKNETEILKSAMIEVNRYLSEIKQNATTSQNPSTVPIPNEENQLKNKDDDKKSTDNPDNLPNDHPT